MNHVTFIYPYYENPLMFSDHLRTWANYSPQVLKNLKFVIIDDGSPKNPAVGCVPKGCKLPLEIFRINEDIPWNQHGARNLGAHVSKGSEWLFMSDMDVQVDHLAAACLTAAPLLPQCTYMMERKILYKNRVEFKVHPNTFLLTSSKFCETGGYDEDYCGTYGGDAPFRDKLKSISTIMLLKGFSLTGISNEMISDASTSRWDREAYHKLYLKKHSEKVGLPYHPQRLLRFSWKRAL